MTEKEPRSMLPPQCPECDSELTRSGTWRCGDCNLEWDNDGEPEKVW